MSWRLNEVDQSRVTAVSSDMHLFSDLVVGDCHFVY